MKMAERDGTGWALAGFAMGILVGVALGVLLAPWSGEETRKKLKELVEKGKEKLEEARDKLFEAGGEEGEAL